MKSILFKIADLKRQLELENIELCKRFRVELKRIFDKHADLEGVRMYKNNHAFNDGDPTSFFLGYEYLTITVNGEEHSKTWNVKENRYESNSIIDELIELFGECHSIHEMLYGDDDGDCDELIINRMDVT